MKTSLIVCLGLAVALAGPPLHTTAAQNHTLAEEDQRPLLSKMSEGTRRSSRSVQGPGGGKVEEAGMEGSDGNTRVEAREEGAEQIQSQLSKATRGRFSPSVVIEGKGYVFFREPKRPYEAESLCQGQFSGGHLASITNYNIHRSVINMLQQNRATNTWIGGLRYKDTARFIWLDGSKWDYADWQKEPNHTAGKEHCVELLPHGSGKFNYSTCWEPQAFICSYPHNETISSAIGQLKTSFKSVLSMTSTHAILAYTLED